ncbi:hypothetical protein [Cecembia calidifontis]|uniref:Uncharacterized protein n=1 Tax=Cecembia calidifontis TaxID=1187080 RepID=A0A4Q7P9Y9_9BACT|nr:hypothetical protein [Cecembia calidifontis]RZS95562.1 hypothetical protein BC751_1096 [Cecembia calidifontis]
MGLLFLVLTSCFENEENFNLERQGNEDLVIKYNFNLEGIKKNVSEGFKVNDLNEFEDFLRLVSNQSYDLENLKNLYSQNGIDLEKAMFKS